MPGSQVTRTVTVEVDGVVGIGELELAALAWARQAPGQLVAATIETMLAELVTTVIGPSGQPLPDAQQLVAPWACTGCGSKQGFRRRGATSKPRTLASACGTVAFRSLTVQCLGCGRRCAPAGQLLGLRPYQRRTDEVSQMAAALAAQMAYAKAERLLGELAGVAVSARSIRRDVLTLAPDQIGCDRPVRAPVLLLDGTGEPAGDKTGGVALHLAIGLVRRHLRGRRVVVQARLLAATLDQPWSAMALLLAAVTPDLIVVDGEEHLSGMVDATWPDVPVQRCLFHLAKAVAYLPRYIDKVGGEVADELSVALRRLLTHAHDTGDEVTARRAYRSLIDHANQRGARRTAAHLLGAINQVFTFLIHPEASRLVSGPDGGPELGTGVLERVMRELNRRTDVGVRWTVEGLRALLMIKLQHKYHQGPWSPNVTGPPTPNVRFNLAA